MTVNQHKADVQIDQLCVDIGRAPLCYSRRTTSEVIDQARIETQSNAVLAVLSVVTCAATFLAVYGGWGL
jgi:hypothetical protein